MYLAKILVAASFCISSVVYSQPLIVPVGIMAEVTIGATVCSATKQNGYSAIFFIRTNRPDSFFLSDNNVLQKCFQLAKKYIDGPSKYISHVYPLYPSTEKNDDTDFYYGENFFILCKKWVALSGVPLSYEFMIPWLDASEVKDVVTTKNLALCINRSRPFRTKAPTKQMEKEM